MLQVVHAARIWDGTGGPVMRDAAIIVEGERVQKIVLWSAYEAPEQATVHDFPEHTVVPGVIDCHVHATVLTREPVSEGKTALLAAFGARRALRAGVTTARDLGSVYQCVFALKDALAGSTAEGPRLLVSGAAICMTGGHGYGRFAMQADGPDSCRHLAREQLRQGADVIKVMASGGAATPRELPTESQLTIDEMRAAVDEAHKAGRPATAHAIPSQAIVDAVEAGVDSIEHGSLLDEATMEAMLRRDVTLVPTLSIYDRMVSHGPAADLEGYVVDKARQILPEGLPRFALAYKAGIRIALGTDSGGPYHPIGDFVREMLLMEEGGMAREQVLLAATRTAAATIHRASDLGTLEAGKLADLVVVRGNPLEDLTAMAQPVLVMKGGRPFDGAAPEPNQDLGPISATAHPRL